MVEVVEEEEQEEGGAMAEVGEGEMGDVVAGTGVGADVVIEGWTVDASGREAWTGEAMDRLARGLVGALAAALAGGVGGDSPAVGEVLGIFKLLLVTRLVVEAEEGSAVWFVVEGFVG